MDPITGGLLSAGINMLGSVFSRKQSSTAQNAIMSNAQGVRQAAEKYGFNPLTLLQYGGAGASGFSGSAPLASQELLTNGVQQLADVASGEAERRYAANELQADLGRVALEQQRALVSVRPSASAAVNNGQPGVGARPAQIEQPYGPKVIPKYIQVYNPITRETSFQLNPELTEAGPVELATGMGVISASEAGIGPYEMEIKGRHALDPIGPPHKPYAGGGPQWPSFLGRQVWSDEMNGFRQVPGVYGQPTFAPLP